MKNLEEQLLRQLSLMNYDRGKILSEQIAKEMDRDILRSLGFEPDRNKRRKKSINKIFI